MISQSSLHRIDGAISEEDSEEERRDDEQREQYKLIE